MNNIRYFTFTICLIFILGRDLKGQDFTSMISDAWENNDQLKSINFQLESAAHYLKEAKSMFGPSVVFGTEYTLAAGGRTIDFPVGDLLNPVYSTLNGITQTNVFPQIDNVSTQLFPNNFYDARFRITQPIYFPDLAINRKLKEESIQIKELEVKAYKRLISKEVMLAYFQYALSEKAIYIYSDADTLLMEAKRTTQSLIKNGVALPTALSRIENQIATVKAQHVEAVTNNINAKRYFNFVTGQDRDESVPKLALPYLPSDSQLNPENKEEIKQLEKGIVMRKLSLDKENQFYLPKLGAQLDFGSQAFDFGFQPYALLGVRLDVNLFDSKRHTHRLSSVKAEVMGAESQKRQLEKQFDLQVNVTKENLNSAILQSQTYLSRIAANEKIYKEIFTKYKEGTANYLELIDAQTQLTQVKIQLLIAQNTAWVKWAEYVYATASYPIQ